MGLKGLVYKRFSDRLYQSGSKGRMEGREINGGSQCTKCQQYMLHLINKFEKKRNVSCMTI